MQDIARLATLEALILALALWLWPFFSRIGIIAPPDTGVIIDTPSTSLTAPTIKTPADVILQYKQNAENWTQQPPNGITFLSQIEQRVFELTNAERRKNGLSPLQPDNLLQKTARTHSLDMLNRNFFDHANFEGKTPQDRIAIIHRSLIGTTGENIWMMDGWDLSQVNVNELAKQAVNNWMNSPGHRENILRKEFTHLGIGGVGKEGKVRLTQNFASIQAILKQPLELQFSTGDLLDLETNSVSRRAAPVQYAFWVPDKGILAAEPLSISDKRVNIAPGEYQMRFYFPGRGQYFIYPGPQVVVK